MNSASRAALGGELLSALAAQQPRQAADQQQQAAVDAEMRL